MTSELSEESKKTYNAIERTLTLKICGKPMNWIINNPEKVIELIHNTRKEKDGSEYSDHTIHGLYQYILKYINENTNEETKMKDSYKKKIKLYAEQLDLYSSKVLSNYQKKEYGDKLNGSLVTWNEIVDMCDKLGYDDPFDKRYLLLSFYTQLHGVLRQDLDAVRLFIKSSPQESDDLSKMNYIIDNKGKLVFHLNEYKTSNKYGEQIINLPSRLSKIIRASLCDHDREYLFVDKYNKKYKNVNSYIKWANRVVKDLFKKPKLTIGMFRKIKVSSKKNMTDEEKINLANSMCHSIKSQQLIYKKDMGDEKSVETIKNDVEIIKKNEEIINKKKIIKKIVK